MAEQQAATNDKRQGATRGLVPTRNERLAAYQQCPALLVEDLFFVFVDDMRPEQCAVHRYAMNKVKEFCPNYERMLKNVARAIIETVTEDPRSTGNG